MKMSTGVIQTTNALILQVIALLSSDLSKAVVYIAYRVGRTVAIIVIIIIVGEGSLNFVMALI